jgi:hypothetical protein
MLALVMSVLALATSHHSAAQAHSTGFPTRGVVVPGKTIGGVGIGMTQPQVRARWGRNYTLYCETCSTTDAVWLYEYKGSEPLGAAVRFQNGKVVAVFTLGSPAGWGLQGAMMGDPVSNVYNLYGTVNDKNCIGYDALTVRIGNSVTSFYSAAGVIYGYALTSATQTPCQ